MVKKLTIFAIMASMAIAAPTFGAGKHGFGLGGSISEHVSMPASAGFTGGVASALEACWAGATSGCVDGGYKLELAAWINGAGKQYFDFLICGEISKWCAGGEYELTAMTQGAMSAAFSIDAGFTTAGGAWAFMNDHIEKSHDGECACQAIDHGHQAPLKTFLGGAKDAAIEKTIRGSLEVCAAGGVAATLSAEALGDLKAWLISRDCQIKGDLLAAVQGWCSTGSGIGIGIGSDSGHGEGRGSIHGRGGANVVLGGSDQQSLTKFCSGPLFGGLDMHIQAGLKACAAGGVAGSLDSSIKVALSGFIKGSSCPLDSGVKSSIAFWLSGETSGGCEEGTSTDAYGYISGGFAISENFATSGSLNAKGQAALAKFCGTVGGSIDAGILASLNTCAHGGFASSLEMSASGELSAWLASSECSLDFELRGSVMAWMSVGISGSGGAGVGIGGGAGFSFDSSALVPISAGISGSAEMSSTVKGALGVCVAGGVASSVDFEARAELGAFLCSDAGRSVGGEIQGQLMEWLCGSSHKHHEEDSAKVGYMLGPIFSSMPSSSFEYTIMNINDMFGNSAGKARKNHGESLRTFLPSLRTSGAIFGFGITAYILLRLKFPDYGAIFGFGITAYLLLRLKFPDYYYERAHGVFNSK
ncbi:hypothetical protein V502_00385 [Pseudogymnoascus sp. VKM F-4520 (FW-2644)]|nr:hypothetical protein V502_00385 [Pseudogymnoascus sp. VKM F-4520 (FW-2644)]